MSTKVISTKIPSEEYNRLIDVCNTKGCSLSEFVRGRILDSNKEASTRDEVKEVKGEVKEEVKENKEIADLRKQVLQLQLDLASSKSKISNHDKKITDLYDWLQIKGLGVDPITLMGLKNRR